MQHETDVRKAMVHFSEDTLDRLYFEMFNKIRKAEAHSRMIAIRAFSLLLCLREPLSPTCFLTALGLVDEAAVTPVTVPDLLRICGNLITIDSKVQTLRFVHTSAQEFLEIQPEFPQSEMNGTVAISCLSTCLFGSADPGATLSPIENFHHYGMVYWPEHCGATSLTRENRKLSALMKEFVLGTNGSSLPFNDWLEDVYELSKALPRHHSLKRELSSVGNQDRLPYYTLCIFGLVDLLQEMSKMITFDWNHKNDSGQTGLYLACLYGHYSVVSFLLDNRVDVEPQGGRLGRPLQAACFEGHLEIVKLMIDHGASAKVEGKFSNAVEASIEGNHEEITLSLLQKGFEIKDQNIYDHILKRASQTGLLNVVEYLQKTYGLVYGDLGSTDCKPIQAAISKGQAGVLQRFIRRTPEATAELPVDSVAVAAVGGHNSVIVLLLDLGLEIERENQFGTPLRTVSLFGHESTVRLLINRGANVNLNSSIGNALEAAALNGHYPIVKLLLQEGIDPNIKGGNYGTSLQAAAYRGHSEITTLLLDKGADMYLAGFTKDAFHAAAEGGHEDVVRLFLDRGFTFRHPPPLLPGAAIGGPRIGNLLRSASPRRRAQREGKTSDLNNSSELNHKQNHALQAAASNGHIRIVELILKSLAVDGVQISANDVGCSLSMASKNGHLEVVKCFLNTNFNIESYLKGAVRDAAREGHIEVLDALITRTESSLLIDDQFVQVCVIRSNGWQTPSSGFG